MTTSADPARKVLPNGDLDLLRKEDARLEKQISTFALIRLAVLVVVTILFASGTLHRNSDESDETVQKIKDIAKDRKESIHLIDPLALYFNTPEWSSAPAPRPGESASDLDALVTKLKAQYTRLLTVRFSVLGTDITLDLRSIILSFPILITLSHMYLSILREKRRLIRFIVYTLNQRYRPDRTPVLDRLMFGRSEGPYRAYPGTLTEILFWIATLTLVGMMVKITQLGSIIFLPSAILMVPMAVFYIQLLTSYLLRPFRRQAEQELNSLVPPDAFAVYWMRFVSWLYSLPARVRPRSTLRAAALLIFFTVVLPTAQKSCGDNNAPPPRFFGVAQSPEIVASESHDNETRPGYQILNHHADWPDGLNTNHLPMWHLYISLLLCAGIALIVSLSSPMAVYPHLSSIRILSIFSSCISILFLNVFGTLLWIAGLWVPKFATKLGGQGITLLMLFLLLLGQYLRQKNPRISHVIQRTLLLLSIPLFLANLVLLVMLTRLLPGTVFLYAGAQLLNLGFLALLVSLASFSPPALPPPAASIRMADIPASEVQR